jgi:hypothetical protein
MSGALISARSSVTSSLFSQHHTRWSRTLEKAYISSRERAAWCRPLPIFWYRPAFPLWFARRDIHPSSFMVDLNWMSTSSFQDSKRRTRMNHTRSDNQGRGGKKEGQAFCGSGEMQHDRKLALK